MGDLLDVVDICHCRREGGSRRRVFYGLCGRAQDASRHPALRGGRLDVGWPVNKVHVLLIGGQDLDGLALTDADLVLFERRVVLSDQHGGGDAVTAAAAYLRRRGKGGGKRTKRKKRKKYRGGGDRRKDGNGRRERG